MYVSIWGREREGTGESSPAIFLDHPIPANSSTSSEIIYPTPSYPLKPFQFSLSETPINLFFFSFQNFHIYIYTNTHNMDEFGILTQSIGFKSQAKSAPMAALKRSNIPAQNSNSVIGSFLGDPDKHFPSSDNQKSFSDDFGDIFGKPLNKSKQSDGSSFDYDSLFKNLNDLGTRASSMPVYDDDIFGRMPGMKNSAQVKKDGGFDFLRNYSSTDSKPKNSQRKGSGKMEKNAAGFDDLLSGFGGSSPPKKGTNLKPSGPQQPTGFSTKSTSTFSEDPFVMLESTSKTNTSSGLFSDPLEQLNQLNSGIYDHIDPFDGFAKSKHMNGSPLSTGSNPNASPPSMPPPLKPEQVSKANTVKSSGVSSIDELEAFAMGKVRKNADAVKSSGVSSVDELEAFAMGKGRKNADATKSSGVSSIDELEAFAMGKVRKNADAVRSSGVSSVDELQAFSMGKFRKNADAVKNSGVSSVDELEAFATGRVRKDTNLRPNVSKTAASVESLKEALDRVEVKFKHAREERERKSAQDARKKEADASRVNHQRSEDNLGSVFGTASRPSSVPRSRTTTSDHVFNTQFPNGGGPEMERSSSSGTSSRMKKAPSVTNIVDDLSAIFGAGMSPGEFQEVEGESEERRRARLGRHQRAQERAARAVSDMNQRDRQTQQEQEEKHRIAEALDGKIKDWARGKEGNLRALLSSLHNVLWTECGWQSVSLTDMITSTSVKKVYRKATLCIHPDKVQQKGANLQQKYIAEKIFDILKEAYNKFNAEEFK